jgi:methylthioribose-1-phosphate isomerase
MKSVNSLTKKRLHAKLILSRNQARSRERLFFGEKSMRTLEWELEAKRLKMIDQRVLPSKLSYIYLDTYQSVTDAIRNMAVRGAPAIGVAAAYGMALAGFQSGAKTVDRLRKDLRLAANYIMSARPTAVNLPWAVKHILEISSKGFESVDDIKNAILNEAERMADEDVETNKRLSEFGARLIDSGDTIIHHCNTGALATVDWGTALGIIRMAHEQEKDIHVLVDETRPRLQGARLTTWELMQYGIPFDLITDNAAGSFIHRGLVNKVIFGADRVARNGDVANKIGSYMLALAANANNIPVYSALPTSTIDFSLATGDEIQIEERPMEEILELVLMGQKATPDGITARNPAFDITPHELITGWVTELGVIYPPFEENIKKLIRKF